MQLRQMDFTHYFGGNSREDSRKSGLKGVSHHGMLS